MTPKNTKKQERKNYINFAKAVVAILGAILVITVIGSLGYLDGLGEKSEYIDSYSKGRFMGELMRNYFKWGLFFGNLFAIVASFEKHKSLPKAILYGILGWVYVIYYAATRKTVFTN